MTDSHHRWIVFSIWPIDGNYRLNTDQLIKLYLSFQECFQPFPFLIPRNTSKQYFMVASTNDNHLSLISEFQNVIFNNICIMNCQYYTSSFDNELVTYIGTFNSSGNDEKMICEFAFKNGSLIEVFEERQNLNKPELNSRTPENGNSECPRLSNGTNPQESNGGKIKKGGKILYISNAEESKSVKPIHLFKLFSNYSGVTSLLFLPNKGYGFLEFQNEHSAKKCSKNLTFHSDHLQLINYISNHKHLARKTRPGENSTKFNVWFSFDQISSPIYEHLTVSKISRYVLAVAEINLEDYLDKSLMVHIYRLFVRIQKCIAEKVKMGEKYEVIEIRSFNKGTFGFILDLLTPAHAMQFVMKFGSEMPKSRNFIARFCLKPNKGN